MLLTAKQKIAYRLHRRQGLPQKDIAAALKITPESVCRLIARAEERIREFIGQCPAGVDCSALDAILR